ncbi:MAG: tetratricopeptide repeat protein [Candidatus Wallbacteria bacterium]|nr:tetratricopeptide repeat protein [Candidatus Wallbacteria bacterium]
MFCFLVLLELVLNIAGTVFRREYYVPPKETLGKKVVLCLGDSVTYGAGVERGQDYPSKLQGLLGNDYLVLNLGIPGANSSDVLHKLRESLKTYRPQTVVIQAGPANAWNHNGLSESMGGESLLVIFREILGSLKTYRLVTLLSGNIHSRLAGNPPSRERFIPEVTEEISLNREKTSELEIIQPPVLEFTMEVSRNSLDFNQYHSRSWELIHQKQFSKLLVTIDAPDSISDSLELGALGTALHWTGSFNEALSVFETGIRKWPDISAFYIGAALSLCELGKLKSAQELLKTGIDKTGPDIGYFTAMGHIYFAAHLNIQALRWLNAALTYDPHDAVIYKLLGDIHEDLAQPERAREYYMEGLRNNPDFEGILFALGNLASLQGKASDAKSWYEKVLAVNPENAVARSRLSAGSTVETALEEYALRHPVGPIAYLDLSRMEMVKNNLPAAREWLEKAVSSNPGSGTAYQQLGDTFFQQYDFEEARRWYEEGIRNAPEFPGNYFGMGNVEVEKKDYSRVLWWFEQAFQKGGRRLIVGNVALSVLRICTDSPDSAETFVDWFDRQLGGFSDTFDLQYYYNSVAVLFLEKGQLERALVYFRKSDNRQAVSLIDRRIREGAANDSYIRFISTWVAKDLEKSVEICRSSGCSVLFLNYPDNENKPARIVAARLGVVLVDAYAAFMKLWLAGKSRQDYLLPDQVHCTPLGNEFMAGLVMEKLGTLP